MNKFKDINVNKLENILRQADEFNGFETLYHNSVSAGLLGGYSFETDFWEMYINKEEEYENEYEVAQYVMYILFMFNCALSLVKKQFTNEYFDRIALDTNDNQVLLLYLIANNSNAQNKKHAFMIVPASFADFKTFMNADSFLDYKCIIATDPSNVTKINDSGWDVRDFAIRTFRDIDKNFLLKFAKIVW